MPVNIHLPEALAGYSGGRRDVALAVGPTTVASLFDQLAAELPALERRIRDESGEIRRHVNVYVDGEDIRSVSGVETPVPDRASVSVIAAISGG
jgi:molybdopterin converting factor small subunit